MCIILSGLCHDVNHTARSNVFESNALSRLAIRYSDASILEHHHISTTFNVLQKSTFFINFYYKFLEENRIFDNITTCDFKDIRKYVINNILYTDNKSKYLNHLI